MGQSGTRAHVLARSRMPLANAFAWRAVRHSSPLLGSRADMADASQGFAAVRPIVYVPFSQWLTFGRRLARYRQAYQMQFLVRASRERAGVKSLAPARNLRCRPRLARQHSDAAGNRSRTRSAPCVPFAAVERVGSAGATDGGCWYLCDPRVYGEPADPRNRHSRRARRAAP